MLYRVFLFVVWGMLSPVFADTPPGTVEVQPPLEDFEKTVRAYQAGDYTKAFTGARLAAQQGDARAQTLLAYLFERGLAGPEDTQKAVQWYGKAAQQKEADALMGLARLAFQNKGGLKEEEAQTYLQKAVAFGRKDAYNELAELYEKGIGVKLSAQKAAFWALTGAKAGEGGAQKRLAFYYLEGQGLPENARQAAYWFAQAARQGDPEAAYAAGVLYADDENSVPADPEKAETFFEQAAKAGDAAAATGLGLLLSQGRGGSSSPQQALDWLQRGAEGGDAEGSFLYAYFLAQQAKGTEQLHQAYIWLARVDDMARSSLDQTARNAWFFEDRAYQQARRRLREALETRLSPQKRAFLDQQAKEENAVLSHRMMTGKVNPPLASGPLP